MTTAQTEIQIHEFSTGIRPERTADGGWVSLGFTGQYMNATINPVPHAIQRSIANKEFAVAEGASSDEPAIIGRVVSGEDSDWSVVAVVTKGRDEKGRSASLYRYFFCEGDKGVSNLWRIIGWIEDYQRSHNGEMPVFNPFDTRDLEQPNLYTTSTPPQFSLLPETEASLLSNSAPILISSEAQYTLQDLNRLANKKAIADDNQQPIAWAYKVKALEQPGRFQIIQAASDKAYELLQKVKATTPQVVAPLIDEQAFKAAIKGLINSSRVKLEHMQAIAEPLGNDQIPESYWKEIFDSQGANNALKQGIYSPQMVRLLTLRAIIIPQTLPEYLFWLGNGNKQNENYTVSSEFQSQIINSLNQILHGAKNIEFNITEGIRLLLPKLLNEPKVTAEAVHELLTTTDGLWAAFHDQVIHELEDDLQLMIKFANNYKDLPFKLTDNSWQNIRVELKQYWRSPSYLQEQYQIFARLFYHLNQYKISAFFYHVSSGKVPKEIFFQVRPNGRQCIVYAVRVEREVTITEQLRFAMSELGSEIMPVSIVSILSIFLLTTGILIGKFVPFSALFNQGSQPNSYSGSTISGSTENTGASAKNELIISKKEEFESIDKLPQTITVIKEISKQLQKEPQLQQYTSIIRTELQDFKGFKVSLKDFLEKPIDNITIEQKISLINAIHKYQKSKGINTNIGYLGSKNDETSKQLINDVISQIKTKNQLEQ